MLKYGCSFFSGVTLKMKLENIPVELEKKIMYYFDWSKLLPFSANNKSFGKSGVQSV